MSDQKPISNSTSASIKHHSWANRIRVVLTLLVLTLVAFTGTYGVTKYFNRPPAPPVGMIWIPPGEFIMGTPGSTSHKNEQPARRVQLTGFFMDETEVTNLQFQLFVEATGYVTTAEKKPDWDEMKKSLPPGTMKPDDSQLVPGSMVFSPPNQSVPLNDIQRWWKWTPGASWKNPEGPNSTFQGREHHPVVHVSWDDAMAYAEWAGKRLPTEAEWEYAARGGLISNRFTWGNDAPSDTDGLKANIWQGDFPQQNTKIDGYERTSPAKTYQPNSFGLYDMAGNVWEWCADWYRADAYIGSDDLTINPKGPATFWDPAEPLVPKRVTRGGSYLCHVTYCESYRPAARRGTAIDTGMSHLGFRCVQDAK